jgi:hypothetical protein
MARMMALKNFAIDAGLVLAICIACYYPATLLLPSNDGIFPTRWLVWMLGYLAGVLAMTAIRVRQIFSADNA